MKVSAKVDYACRALMELSLHWPNETPVQIGTVAKRQNIPLKFLVHILIHLKEMGCVESVRGKAGGYILSKSPDQIKFSDVVKGFGGMGYSATHEQKKKKNAHVLDLIWQDIDQRVLDVMNKINFETISNQERSKGKVMTYEI